MPGRLFVVATPIGNLEDISARALRVLREVALIAAEDTRRTAHLLRRFGITTHTISYHEHSRPGKAESIVERLRCGDDVALVSDAGTPTLSDPGSHLVRLAHEAGLKVESIPGPSAVVAALSVAGFAGDSFIFLGFPPIKPAARATWFERLRRCAEFTSLVVFFEAPHKIGRTTEEMLGSVGDLEVCVARELTKAHEDVYVGRLSGLPLDSTRGEYTVVVNIGQTTVSTPTSALPSAAELTAEFVQMTENGGLSRRLAITSLSRRYAVSARVVYNLLESGKKSGV
jgi:16S rRNA (cytidine1402-2'-O)-methyltransferase